MASKQSEQYERFQEEELEETRTTAEAALINNTPGIDAKPPAYDQFQPHRPPPATITTTQHVPATSAHIVTSPTLKSGKYEVVTVQGTNEAEVTMLLVPQQEVTKWHYKHSHIKHGFISTCTSKCHVQKNVILCLGR